MDWRAIISTELDKFQISPSFVSISTMSPNRQTANMIQVPSLNLKKTRVPVADHFSEGPKKTMLQNAVPNIADLCAVKQQV